MGLGTLFGTLVGLVSGYFVGKVDQVLQRVVDTLMAIPAIVLALAVITMLEPGLFNIILVIAIVIAPGTSRVVRGTVLAIKENVYIEAARSIGAGGTRIVFRHILPNVVAPIIVIASIWVGNAIVIEAALSYLGLGTPPPTPTWGACWRWRVAATWRTRRGWPWRQERPSASRSSRSTCWETPCATSSTRACGTAKGAKAVAPTVRRYADTCSKEKSGTAIRSPLCLMVMAQRRPSASRPSSVFSSRSRVSSTSAG